MRSSDAPTSFAEQFRMVDSEPCQSKHTCDVCYLSIENVLGEERQVGAGGGDETSGRATQDSFRQKIMTIP